MRTVNSGKTETDMLTTELCFPLARMPSKTPLFFSRHVDVAEEHMTFMIMNE